MRTSACTSALGLSALASVAFGAEMVASCYNYQTNTDYPGNDIKSTLQASASNCCADCVATPGCQLYVWTGTNGGTCYLKSAAGSPATVNGAQSAFATPATCYNYQSNTDYPGNDIKSTLRASASNCCGDCAATSGCKLYVWTSTNGGTCYLKSAAGAPATVNGAQSAFTTPATCYNYQSNTDYPGNDIKSTLQASASNCCDDCAATQGCKLYVWTGTNGGTCYLKYAAGAPATVNGAQSAFTSPLNVGTCGAVLANTDFTDQDIANVPGSTPAQCCTACLNNYACNAWSLSNNICWLKSGSNNQHPAAGVTSSTVNKCSAPQTNTDFYGNDLTNTPAAAATSCCAICRNTSGCTAYSWYQGVCYLKSSAGTPSNKAGVTSATVL
ncbi:hypothetical protein ACHHYP_03709 [Achlya hypogyna]|uniref:Secreted protein n=1 Tax=Achlya hypogyna TaxID=1202772 RepID=A0A0A7CN88_ACHHY|nr:secreted protein [Achlya hypogyna]OQR92440.1 hypothetical protein ACHHYP_03709 [Achlya hypogyna]